MHTRRAILVSSTAVFGDAGGGWVNAGSVASDTGARARRLLDIEACWRASLRDPYVLRLGGLYGRGRVVGRRTIEAGVALTGNGDDWLNLVRVEDAAAAALATARVAAPLRCGLITDGTPVLRRDYYAHLAAM